MSLLLDALKRAEQAKQAKAGEPVQATDLAAAGSPANPETTKSSTSALQLEEIQPAPQPQFTKTPSAAQMMLGETQRESARNVFASKQARGVESRSWMLPVLGSAILVIGAGGWYVWTQVSKLSTPSSVRAPQAPAPITQAPRELPSAKPDTGQIGTAPPSVGQPAASSGAPIVPLPERVASVKPASSAAERARESLIKSMKEATAVRDAPLSLRMTTGIEPPRVSAELASAYTALRAGNYAESRRLYGAVLASDSLNLDARLGLATTLARTGDNASAAREYRKALEIDPRNATALASLLVVSDQNNLGALEVELKTLMARTPDSAPLAFALGNVYAAQSRWTEAQQAYFDAFRFEPENADYLYNLAVSLDQLKQPKLALDYYQRALTAAGKGGGQFDRAQAVRRANELKSPS
jgi:tetratricopeptide (TPR) repeat protein